ncbi:MAG: glycosyltransferase [Alphaproteobacteria bacterium]|nr:glycosyltransferase [Alphaproteobacteria bacterium]
MLTLLALLACAAWLYLAFRHGRFWRGDQRLDDIIAGPTEWPSIAVVIPARNEADVIGRAVASHMAQDYPGAFHVFVVDDRSTDATATVAREAGDDTRLTIVTAPPLPDGWAGKVAAMAAGTAEAMRRMPNARYILFTDADIEHPADHLRRLVAKAEANRLDMTSLMVKLEARTFWERLLIPAFVFFFQKLYPFPLVNDPSHRMAGAAGGCMLVRRTALERIGGMAAIKGEIIDDCALARAIKPGGPIWLGLSADARSLRPYGGLGGIWRMVARSAFNQLRYSTALLAGCVLGMLLLYIVPPWAALDGLFDNHALLALLGVTAWATMAVCYKPTLDLYRRPAWEALLLPVAAIFYVLMTVDSARAHWAGRGGAWKGRTYT